MSIKINSIVQQAFNLANLTSEEFAENVDGTRADQAILKLNNILGQFNLDQLFPFARKIVEYQVSTSKNVYSIGIDDGDIPVVADIQYDRPVFINSISYRTNVNAFPTSLMQIDLVDLEARLVRTATGSPVYYSVDGEYPLTNIYFNVQPMSGAYFTFIYNKEIPQVGINDTIAIPNAYADILVCALARRLAVNMPPEIVGNIDALYKDAYYNIEKYNARFAAPLDRVLNHNSIEAKMSRFNSGRNF
jgi:hypothetical protein